MIRAILCVSILFSTAAYGGEQTRVYDSRGRSVGTATTDSQGTTVFRDSGGNTVGSATKGTRK
jgi:hypothetical protein